MASLSWGRIQRLLPSWLRVLLGLDDMSEAYRHDPIAPDQRGAAVVGCLQQGDWWLRLCSLQWLHLWLAVGGVDLQQAPDFGGSDRAAPLRKHFGSLL